MWLHVPREALSASAPESEGSISGSPEPVEWSLWCTSSGKPLLQPSSWPGWKKRSWRTLLSGTTCAPSTLARGVDWWISSLVELRARTSASLGSALGWMAAAPGSSLSTSGSPSSARLRSSSGRTSPEQLGLFHVSASTSPKTDTATAPGPSFVRVTLEPITSAPGSSSWPTATASCHTGPGGDREGGPNLQTRAALWPTATDARASGAAGYSTDSGRHSGTTLTDAAVRQRRWPTPNTGESQSGHGRRGGKSGNGHQSGADLEAVARAWPTPSARDWRSGLASEETHARNSRPLNEVACRASLQAPTTEMPGAESSPSGQTSPLRSQLNPAFVEWLMGWPEGWTLPYVRTASGPAATESTPSRPPTPGAACGSTSFP